MDKKTKELLEALRNAFNQINNIDDTKLRHHVAQHAIELIDKHLK